MTFVVPFPDSRISRDQLQQHVRLEQTTATKTVSSNNPQFDYAFSPRIFLSTPTVHYRLGSVRTWIQFRPSRLAELPCDQPAVKLRRDA
ncbi:hypothetical protein [Burkholderia pseudomallei]|uniref:hypothetical protein n=1 Tax=Burkholderia pseudomallei TaxID=28450 RepID=UPI0012B817B0